MKTTMYTLLLFPTAMVSALGGYCPPTGPVLPPPNVPRDFSLSDLSSAIDNLLQAHTPGISWDTSSFSLEITSTEETFFEYHHTASIRNETGASSVDTNTVYRVASITKVINTLALLIHAPNNIDDPITWHVPELASSEMYHGISLRMLASHIGGVAREGGAFDMYLQRADDLQQGGFPNPPPGDIPTCDWVGLPMCTRSEFFQILLSNELSWLPGDRAAYSNQAFILLAIALENITGKKFGDLISESIAQPLGLTSTSLEPPEISRAIIPTGPGSVFIELDIGTVKSSAGFYSSPGDLSALIRSILGNTLLSDTKTREWFKPLVFAGSFSTALGMPWEIFRLANLTPDGRPIDVYSKSGGVPGYEAYIIVLPDYQIGATLLVSAEDPVGPVAVLLDLLITTLVPTMDSLARHQARERYAGRYMALGGSGSTNVSDNNSLEIAIDEGPGLRIVEWINKGKSILSTFAKQENMAGEEELDARIYPVGDGSRWRMILESTSAIHTRGLYPPSVPSEACQNWFHIDQMRYAGKPVDVLTFVADKHGVITSVKNNGLRVTLHKVA